MKIRWPWLDVLVGVDWEDVIVFKGCAQLVARGNWVLDKETEM